MNAKANEILEFVRDYQTEVYTFDILDRIEAHNEYMDKNKVREIYYYNTVEEVTKSILELITKETFEELSEYFSSLSDTVITFIMARFQNYEQYLEALGEGEVDVPENFQNFLKYVLITHWDEQVSTYSFCRNN